MAAAGIVMETINLPEGNAFGVDDVESGTPTVDYAEHQAKTLFFVWVTLTEQKWVIFGERRGARPESQKCCGFKNFLCHDFYRWAVLEDSTGPSTIWFCL